jgi:hypothetical protein
MKIVIEATPDGEMITTTTLSLGTADPLDQVLLPTTMESSDPGCHLWLRSG